MWYFYLLSFYILLKNHDVTSTSIFTVECRTPESRDARLHSTKLVATQQPRSEPSRLKDGAYCKNGFTRQALRMLMSYDAGLLRNGTSWTSAQLTKQLESGERDFKHVWLQMEDNQDSLNTRCEHLSFMTFCIGILTRPNSLKYCCFVQ